MDLSEKDKFGLEKRGEDHLSYQTPGIPSNWRFGNPQMGLITPNTSISVCQGDQMGSSILCPSVSMVDSFGPGLWDHPSNSQNLRFSESNVQTSTSLAHNVPIRNPVPGPSRFDMGWNPSGSISKGGMFVQNGSGIPPSLSQFPTDSSFIERAARFSCFNGGNFSGMLSPFGIDDSSSPYSNAPKGVSGDRSQKNELNIGDSSNDVSMSVDDGSNMGRKVKAQRDTGSIHGVGVSGNETGEAEFSGGDQEEAPNSENAVSDPPSKGLGAKKRKRGTQEMELDQAKGDTQLSAETSKENFETKQKVEPNNSTAATVKPSGKHGKDSADAPDDYIHVRARRGQATNSHSLAERVRREKISERMKFLQDLVPGCSKVTGKAVMLDEIINYVQSLQRQVEFLSMKLATVNPRLDLNIEGLLSKENLQSRAGSSSIIGFPPDMAHPQLHPAQQGLVQSGIPGLGNPSDALRRAINAQLTAMNAYKESTPQMPNARDDELHNVIQMGFGTNAPLNIHESNGKTRDGFPA